MADTRARARADAASPAAYFAPEDIPLVAIYQAFRRNSYDTVPLRGRGWDLVLRDALLGQTKPVFVHKLICRGTIEDRILELQAHKARLVKSLLSEDTASLRMDAETLSHLLAPLG